MKTRFLILLALALPLTLFAASDPTVAPQSTIATPAITIAAATADTGVISTAHAREAHVYWKFGTVSGTYTTCTVQAYTTFDGTNYLTLGSAVSITATTGTATAWSLFAQAGTTSVTTSSPSTTAALSFGKFTKFTFACSGAYGTMAPATISAIFR